MEVPPRDVLVEVLSEVIKINWKNTFEHSATVRGADAKVDWIESIKVLKFN